MGWLSCPSSICKTCEILVLRKLIEGMKLAHDLQKLTNIWDTDKRHMTYSKRVWLGKGYN